MSSIREKIMKALCGKGEKGIPFGAYSFLLPRGEIERRLRNSGLGIFHFEKPYAAYMKEVEVVIKEGVDGEGRKYQIRRFLTPLGNVEEKILFDPGYGSQWIKEFLIKNFRDYEIVAFIFENTFYVPNYEGFTEVEKNMGDDGIVFANVERSPFQKTLLELAGPERLMMDLFDAPGMVEDFLKVLRRKQLEMYEIVAKAPALFVHNWDNVTEEMTSPHLFEKYCLPFYDEVGSFLRGNGKKFVVHMDGKLKNLKDLIAQVPIDVVESFTLKGAGGNLDIEEAQKIWTNKSVIANFPAFLCFKEERYIREYFENLFSRVDKSRFMICVSEDLPHGFWEKALLSASAFFDY